MNWWKRAEIADLVDRNRYNRAVHRLEQVSEWLTYASQLIYMTARGARSVVADIRTNKSLSTYPEIGEVLRLADQVALDSPGKFSVYCLAAAEAIEGVISDLKRERDDYNTDEATKLKGWIDE